MLALRVSKPNLVQWVRKISCTPSRCSAELFVHRDSPDNNAKTAFAFTGPNLSRITALLQNYPIGYERSVMGAALDIVQRQMGWIPIAAMHCIADMLHIPRIRVYEYATFYTMNKRRFRGKFHVKVCVTACCMIRGSDLLLEMIENVTCCKVGGLSPDGMFGVDIVQCAGACANAPVINVNDDYFEDVTPSDAMKIIKSLQSGFIPPPGPQSGRFAAEPITGLTSLCGPPPVPGFKIQKDLC